MNIRFGPSGNDKLFYESGYKSTTQAPKWLREVVGLDALEISFGRGIRMSVDTAAKIGDEAKKYDIEISVHAPYYINLVNSENFDKNYRWIEQSLILAKAMGGKRVIVHPASQGDYERKEALRITADNLARVINKLDENGYNDFLLCIETMGRYSNIGNVQEICDLCKIDSRIVPTLDFGHINCLLQGELSRNPEKFFEIMDFVELQIGKEKMKNIHIHFSAIVYSDKGERHHTILSDTQWTIPFEPLGKILKDKKLTNAIVICESEYIMAQDAKTLKNIFESQI
ncbi:MAG: TIM barrel protein [Firmicutes bacterium]|nr:TIM barrel protein [Bacillota bacterium]